MSPTRILLIVVAIAVASAYAVLRLDLLAPRTGPFQEESRAALQAIEPPDWAATTTRPPEVRQRLRAAAERAWGYIERHYRPETGLVATVPDYPVATMWDVASTIGAFHAARELGLLPAGEYARRMERLLRTLGAMPLFEGIAFNKAYDTGTARMVGREGRPSDEGYGWSALDMGRLLVWLRIIAVSDPALAPSVERVVERLDLGEMVADGYLRGGERLRRGVQRFQEGRIGYEQYAAHGFALWGAQAGGALDLTRNTRPVDSDGVTLLEDVRPHGCLTSEPLVLQGLELGWSEEEFRLAAGLLAAQRARAERSGVLTATGEDASHAEPHYFYYYCVRLDGESYVVAAQGQRPAPHGPRTISTKMAFGWYALAPNAYTRRLVDAIAAGSGTAGWPAGLLEAARTPAGPENVNTAAVILESAAFAEHGRPLLDAARRMRNAKGS